MSDDSRLIGEIATDVKYLRQSFDEHKENFDRHVAPGDSYRIDEDGHATALD